MIAEVQQSIRQGLEDTYLKDKVLKEFSIDPHSAIIEYLFTLHVATRLLTLRTPGSKMLIHLEYSAKDFINNAFAFNLKPLPIRRKHRTIRKGRIDIAILETAKHYSLKSIIGIELKGINPPKTGIAADVKRLAHAMWQRDPVGENSIVVSFLAFAVRLKRRGALFYADEMPLKMSTRKAELTGHMARVLRPYKGISGGVEVWPIDVLGGKEVAKRTPEEFHEHKDIARETVAMAGVLVTLSRSPTALSAAMC